MRILKRTIVTVMVCLVSLALLSCNAASSKTSAADNQGVAVQRGNLVIDITAVGNLALSHTVDLPFDIPAAFDKTVALTVQEVLVQEGESVEEGQLLAKLDTSTWEDQLSALEDKAIATERNVTTKKRALTSAERQITTKELAVRQAQLNLQTAELGVQTAEDNLNEIAEVKAAKDAVDKAQDNLDIAQIIAETTGIAAGTGSSYRWDAQVLNQELARAKSHLAEILNGSTLPEDVALQVAKSKLQVEQSKIQVEHAQGSLEDAQFAIETAQIAIEDAKIALDDAQKAEKDAQKALDEAKKASSETKAPFSGFIAKVNVVGGAEVKKGTVAVTIADPTKFEAEVMVGELDILKLKLGGAASVQVQAMPGVSLSAKITRISPTATIQSGVVNYKVTVEVVSLQPVTPLHSLVRDNLPPDNISSGAPSEGFRRPFAGDNLTQGQRQQAWAGQPGGQAQPPAIVPEEVKLVEGLTVTVSITIAERSNVLLVPIQAIISQGRETFVQVSQNGVIEERPVTVGISNWQYAEITDGLSEGEQVIVPKTATSTTPATSQPGQRSPARGIVPGMPRIIHD